MNRKNKESWDFSVNSEENNTLIKSCLKKIIWLQKCRLTPEKIKHYKWKTATTNFHYFLWTFSLFLYLVVFCSFACVHWALLPFPHGTLVIYIHSFSLCGEASCGSVPYMSHMSTSRIHQQFLMQPWSSRLPKDISYLMNHIGPSAFISLMNTQGNCWKSSLSFKLEMSVTLEGKSVLLGKETS